MGRIPLWPRRRARNLRLRRSVFHHRSVRQACCLVLYPAWDQTITATLNEVRNRVRTGITVPDAIVDVRAPVSAMRLHKDEQEITLLRRAAEISSGAHRRAMERTRPGWYEYQVEA